MENTISAGLVVTGGTALLDGVPEIAESVLGLPCRLGRPQGITGLTDVVNNPMYATGVGLVHVRRAQNAGQEIPHPRQEYLQQHHAANEEMVQGSHLTNTGLAIQQTRDNLQHKRGRICSVIWNRRNRPRSR
jgi:cell division ATPase FtsA